MTSNNCNAILNIVFTTAENQSSASAFTQQYGGTVAVSHPVFINSGGFLSMTKSDTTVNETQGIKLTEWYCDGDYAGSEIEKTLSKIATMVEPDVYVISGNSSKDAEILNKIPN